MAHESFVHLIIVALAMALAAGIPAVLPRLPVPGVVLELVLGILIGPQVLGLVHPGEVLTFLADLGLGMVFLMAGFEMDPAALAGQPIRKALSGWGITLVIAFGAALLLTRAGLASGWVFSGLVLTTTAIGVLMPILRDQGLLAPPYGPMVLSAGAVGEAGPVVLLSLALAKDRAPVEALILVAFGVASALAVVLAARTRGGRLAGIVERSIGTSGQLPMRLAVFILILLVVTTEELDIDVVLGAFVAGAFVRAATERRHDAAMTARLDGLGSAFLVPIFFVTSGIRMDVTALFTDPVAMATVPIYALLFLMTRGVPAFLLYRSVLSLPQRAALALHCGTQITVVVAITGVAVKRGAMPGAQGAALVVAVVIFPALASRVLRRSAASRR